MAETAQRQGTPGQEGGAEGGPDPDTLHAVQRETLRPARAAETATGEPAVKNAQPTIRRFSGNKRTVRVGPLRFTDYEHAGLQEAATEHGKLPLSEDRRRTHMFRAQVLRQLNRIGVNINQIARALNSDLTPPDICHRLDELHHLLELIAEALRQPADRREDLAA
ncbi:MobC family plasmid mobilization relaxosome protein [Streptomyces sioyaensis]|uniref:MobC family plasmid mobilization relaxosome protein n=1 Tax=Streptomyces sioyaensis TaxID=67364 RepID=UPI0033CE7011